MLARRAIGTRRARSKPPRSRAHAHPLHNAASWTHLFHTDRLHRNPAKTFRSLVVPMQAQELRERVPTGRPAGWPSATAGKGGPLPPKADRNIPRRDFLSFLRISDSRNLRFMVGHFRRVLGVRGSTLLVACVAATAACSSGRAGDDAGAGSGGSAGIGTGGTGPSTGGAAPSVGGAAPSTGG